MMCWQISLRIAKQRLRWWSLWHWQDVRAARCAIVGDHGAVARCIWVYCYRGILGLVQFVDRILETFERKDASGPEASDNVLFFHPVSPYLVYHVWELSVTRVIPYSNVHHIFTYFFIITQQLNYLKNRFVSEMKARYICHDWWKLLIEMYFCFGVIGLQTR